jgi:hypothetical protein
MEQALCFGFLKFFCCFDQEGTLIARCQTMADVEVLKSLGRPVAKVVEMEPGEAVVCRVTDSPASFNEDF